MSNTSANLHNLNDGRAQALLALQNVSERLGDILGEVGTMPGDGTHRNENGELVNEEGLPIIDITEPLDELDTPSLSAATEEDEAIEEDNYPEPISNLSPEALAISRQHRDKILDLLEDEESREESRTRRELQTEMERKREAARIEMQKRMVTQKADLDKRRRDKELEKKRAKAMLSGLEDPQPAVAVKTASQSQDKEKKSVTFADPPSTPESSTAPAHVKQTVKASNWGDVIPGKLHNQQQPLKLPRSQPMKMEVVERSTEPSSSIPMSEVSQSTVPAGDSDDETDSEDASDSTVAFDSGDEDIVLSAQRHRELALDYHKRRTALASSASAILPEDIGLGPAHTDDSTHDRWDSEQVPLEATLAHPPPKPPVSKFRTSRVNATQKTTPGPVPQPTGLPPSPQEAHTPDTLSTFGTSVLPPSALAKSVKMGKLVDGKLVAGDEEEDEKEREAKEEEEIRKLLLKSMEDYSGIAAQAMGPKASGSYWAKPDAAEVPHPVGAAQPLDLPKPKPTMSRFKVNRTRSRVPSESSADAPASSTAASTSTLLSTASAIRALASTPVSSAERSSPKLTPSDAPTSSPYSQTTVIDSPSFAPISRGGDPMNNNLNHAEIVDSPSFQPPASAKSRTVIDSPSFQASSPTIIDSPSFMRPASSSSGTKAPPTRKPPTVIPSPSRPPAERDPAVMVNDVKERSGDRASAASAADARPQRVSRFKAERSGG